MSDIWERERERKRERERAKKVVRYTMEQFEEIF